MPHQPTSHPIQDPVRTRPSARPDRERPVRRLKQLDDVAAAVDAPVEAGRPSAACAAVQSTEDLVDAFGNRVRDATSSQVGADLSRAVPLVGNQMVGPGPRTPGPDSGHADRTQHLLQACAVVGVAARQDEPERAAESVAGQVDFRAQSATGSAEGVITRFVPVDCPLLPPAACWWARTMVESTDTSQSMSPAASRSA